MPPRRADRRSRVGLIAGALIGDHLMGQQNREQEQAVEAEQNDRELERLRLENQRLRKSGLNDEALRFRDYPFVGLLA